MMSTTQKEILLADDEVNMLRLYEMSLKKAGYRTVACKDGTAALEQVGRSRPDLAVLDYFMPGKSGLEIIEEFRADPLLADIPVIVVTGQREVALRERLLAAGATEVISKPFSLARLASRVDEILEGAA